MFTDAQKKALEADLKLSNVKTREQSGRKLSFVEGWHVIAEANRIFGFDGWSSETITTSCVAQHEREVGRDKVKGWGVTYTAKVKIEVHVGGGIIREGTGTGHGIDRDLGQAHESAIKEAETDARKRALMTFGNQFGLALYDKTQENVEDDTRPPPRQPAPKAEPKPATPSNLPPSKVTPAQWCLDQIDVIRKSDYESLIAWEKKNARAMDILKADHESLWEDVRDNIVARKEAIGTP